ncbi:MAG: peptidylprolyl isomerase [Paracoccaceae bacterium]
MDNKKQDGPLQNTRTHFLIITLTAIALLGAMALGASAQGLFSPVVLVNDKGVTRYEVEQRKRLLEMLNTAGDLDEIALQRLIDERVQLDAAEQVGIKMTDEQISDGLDEFGARANLTGQQLLDNLAGTGVEPQTFRDFVIASLSWRALVQAKFRGKAQINQTDVALAKGQLDPRATAKVLISEIFLPTNTPENAAKTEELLPQIRAITSFEGFADAARRFSAGQSREVGGRVSDWVPLANLPPPIAAEFLTMKPGQVTQPLPIPDAIAIFQLRAFQESDPAATANTLDYAAYYIPGGRSEAALERAARIRAEVDRCDDLYGIAQGQPPEVLERVTLPQAQVPTDVALELARLDPGEVSTNLTRAGGQTLVFLMLCARTPEQNIALTEDDIRQALFGKRLEGYANNYLAQLRADAIIRYP